MRQHRWLKYLGPVPAMVMIFTMLFQSFHKMEHVAECHESHACCYIPHHSPTTDIVTHIGDFLLIETGEVSICFICQYEFTFCSEIKNSITQTANIFPDSFIPGYVIDFYHSFNGLHKQLRAPPSVL
ncbi:hypothetical protein [Natronoflexus pectinivorans]|uniref:Uncharacterized protein n=1 Tax=Natronoflexus pectinivorans TaxID=682526 RepID=A0A4R2GMA1_9BACT|nr:hypothetical protein [Natronoflexus pectinivorans]TCO09838.1 hypothetical protein EV194_102267 [Natronoflexus pectinivorans]